MSSCRSGEARAGLARAAAALLILLVACADPGPPNTGTPPPAQSPRLYPAWSWADQPIDWMAWGKGAFAAARERRRPILLYVAAPGAEGAFSSDESVLRSLAEERFVPVRVDPFKRPDLARRYAPAGWPSLVVVDTSGRAVAAATDPAPDRTRLFLTRILHHLQARPEVVEARVASSASAGRAAGGTWTVGDAISAIADDFDRGHGGFGRGTKALEWPVLLLLLEWHSAHGDRAALEMVEQTVAHLLASPTWDSVDGGVFVYSYTPDWHTPHGEKDAADQAGLLTVLSQLPELRDEHREAMALLVAYGRDHLVDPTTGLVSGRRVQIEGTWWADPVAYVDRQALVARAMLAAAARLDGAVGAEARGLGLAAADAMASRFVGDGGRVIPWVQAPSEAQAGGGDPPGLVSSLPRNQILVADALLEADATTGVDRYGDLARSVLAHMDEELWDPARGVYRPATDPAIDGVTWPAGDIQVDGALPAGNAVVALICKERGHLPQRTRRLMSARPAGPPDRAHATWARALLAHADEEIEVR